MTDTPTEPESTSRDVEPPTASLPCAVCEGLTLHRLESSTGMAPGYVCTADHRVRLLVLVDRHAMLTPPDGFQALHADADAIARDVYFTLAETAAGFIGDPESHEVYGSVVHVSPLVGSVARRWVADGVEPLAAMRFPGSPGVVRTTLPTQLVIDAPLLTPEVLDHVLSPGYSTVGPDGEETGEPPLTVRDAVLEAASTAALLWVGENIEWLSKLGAPRETVAALYGDDEPF